jgi:hypothetical protein
MAKAIATTTKMYLPVTPPPKEVTAGQLLCGPDPVFVKVKGAVPEGYVVYELQEIHFDADLNRRKNNEVRALQQQSDRASASLMTLMGDMPVVSLKDFANEGNAHRPVSELVQLVEEEKQVQQEQQLKRQAIENPEASALIQQNQWDSLVFQVKIACIYWGLDYEVLAPVLDAPKALSLDYSKGFIPDWLTLTSQLLNQTGNG